MQHYNPEDFSPHRNKAIPVRLAARSFIIPVPKGIGKPMVYPFDIPGEPLKKKGMPLLDDRGFPQGTGIVFINHTDGAIQTARDNGEQSIIINGISEEQARLLSIYALTTIPDPETTSAAAILSLLAHAHKTLGIDDFFDGEQKKTSEFTPENLQPGRKDFGTFIRRSPEERFALLGLGSGSYEGPAGSPQIFKDNVVVVFGPKYIWMVQTRAFLKTYRHPDDRGLALQDLPTVVLKPAAPSPAPIPARP